MDSKSSFAFSPTQSTVAFIDGTELTNMSKTLRLDIDYAKLRQYLQGVTNLRRLLYFVNIPSNATEFTAVKKVTDWLTFNQYTVESRPVRSVTDHSTGRQRWSGNVNVPIAASMVDMGSSVDHMILFSGDSDLVDAIKAVQRRGVRVTVASTVDEKCHMCSDELRRLADGFFDVAAHAAHFRRDRLAPALTPSDIIVGPRLEPAATLQETARISRRA